MTNFRPFTTPFQGVPPPARNRPPQAPSQTTTGALAGGDRAVPLPLPDGRVEGVGGGIGGLDGHLVHSIAQRQLIRMRTVSSSAGSNRKVSRSPVLSFSMAAIPSVSGSV